MEMLSDENKFGLIDRVEITVLMDDYAGFDSAMIAVHGASYLVEVTAGKHTKTILFDTGQSTDSLLHNMALLKKDIKAIDYIILSHCHYDHTGGLLGTLQAIGKKSLPIVAHPDIFRQSIALDPCLRSIGFYPGHNRSALEAAGGELILTTDPLKIMPGILTTGEITRRVEFENQPTLSTYTLNEGQLVPDLLTDDLSMVLLFNDSIAVLTGCSHAGIISIIQTAVNITGVDRIKAVIGGFHLLSADAPKIKTTVEKMKEINPAEIFTGHCSGLKAEAALQNSFGSRFHKLSTGLEIKL
ncbi:MAG: MBL fold metallo-hydrolase [Bacillota bacterium]|nr:MBL fold metallo-hydrolase [Bacillota bacterium]